MKDYIKYLYENYNEDGRLTAKSHLPEYLTTMKYIEKYVKPGDRILEIGAGTGRYSIALADKGYEVDSVELVPHNIEILKSKIKKNHNIRVYEGNACDLNFIESNKYDIVLLLGPMYHLYDYDDKNKAICEAIRAAKTGAVIYSSYCNNDTSIFNLFYRHNIVNYMKNNYVSKDFHANSVPELVFELYRKSDVDALMKNYNVTRLNYVGVDMLSYIFDNSFDDLTDEEFELYMQYIFSICEREDMVGFSIHMLDIFRKNS